MKRFTPAHAGNTNIMVNFIRNCKVHPRSRGEYQVGEPMWQQEIGSPPLTRGILYDRKGWARLIRFTPAHAGNTKRYQW